MSPNQQSRFHLTARPNRRTFLGGALAGGAVLLGGATLVGCGSGSTAGTRAASAGPQKKGGTLRLALFNDGPGSIDPHLQSVTNDACRAVNAHDYLAYRKLGTSEVEYRLAESITSNATGDVWTVKLRDGVVSHQGKKLSADDVIYSIKRMFSLAGSPSNAMLGFIDPKGVVKKDDLTVVFNLPAPYAEFIYPMMTVTSVIVPDGYDPKTNPDGFGPFKISKYEAASLTVYDRFDDYYGQVAWVDQVRASEITDPQARLNALIGGQVDYSDVPAEQVKVYESNAAYNLVTNKTGGFRPIAMNCQVSPYDQVAVRQALRLLVDRDQLVTQAFNGSATAASDLHSPHDPDFRSDLVRTQDIDQAKSLLKQAGYEDLQVELFTAEFAPGVTATTQVFAEQAKAAGVDVKITTLQTNAYFGDRYLTYPLSMSSWSEPPSYLAQVAFSDLKASTFKETHFEDAEFESLYKQANRQMDDAKRGDLKGQMQEIQFERGGYIIPAFINNVDAYTTNVVGAVESTDGYPMGFHYNQLSLA
ncbi:ABC transporter substrate-binding protein [Nocardioides sp. GY 10127]|uniref:ABC transporter substrate-binding protein n=1 Tax=Nocardioides sp. GY 10127 TaxID=2569762 RepID=UPI0014580A8A|nr:ABC transporter substrate-binding protein [Nocardioides sp. GY 10127]